MTRITFDMADLQKLMEHEITPEEVLEYLPMVGSDVEGINDDGEVSVELFPDRPDLYSVEGVARALSAYLGLKPGLRAYPVSEGDIELTIDPSVLPVRPIMLSAVVRGVSVDDAFIKSIMQLQEKLHLTLGRKRKKVSIGLHDLDTVTPPFTYKAVLPTEVEFEPLQMEGEYLNLDEILRRHPKGRDYSWILEGHDTYPLFVDANNQVLSFPPIINGVITTVTENTRDILMDVTGLDFNGVSGALNIILAVLADRGGTIESVKIKVPAEGRRYYMHPSLREVPDGFELVTPLMEPITIDVETDYIKRIIGIDLSDEEIKSALERMGHDAEVKGGIARVTYPAYRQDILHPIDIVEEVATGYGYMNIPTNLPQEPTFGSLRSETRIYDTLSRLMIGLGYTEITTLTLSNQKDEYINLNLPEDERALVLKNPLTEQHTIAKTRTLGGLMNMLRLNKHRDMPQRIFEIGDVVIMGENKPRMGYASIHPKASFTEVKSVFETVMANLGVDADSIDYREDHYYDGIFIPGRHAQAILYDETIGYFGEVHPEVLERYELGAQVVLGEVLLDTLKFLFEKKEE